MQVVSAAGKTESLQGQTYSSYTIASIKYANIFQINWTQKLTNSHLLKFNEQLLKPKATILSLSKTHQETIVSTFKNELSRDLKT